MKILMLSSFYPPILGGMGTHVRSVSRELVKRGHEVVVCTTLQRGLPKREEDDGIKVLRLQGTFQRIPFLFKDPDMRHHPPTYDWSIGKQLKQAVEKYEPNIINAHGWMLYSLLAWVKHYDTPLVLSLMDCEFICPKQSLMSNESDLCDHPFKFGCVACGGGSYGLAKSIATYCGIKRGKQKLKSVDKFIAISSFTKQINTKYLGLNDNDITVIPCFYDPKTDIQTENLEDTMGLPDDFILFVGALSPHKGTEVLIKAYKKLNTRTKLVLIGSSHPDYHYETREDITVFENAPRSVVIQAMSGCRFAVFPSIWAEGFGIVAIEAMSQKKAVIASDIGGFKDTIENGETGFLVTPRAVDELAGAMDHLIKNPQKAVQMGLKGYDRFLKNFTPGVVVPRLIALYENLCSKQEGI